jgi:putative methionine-R-sulfoxide reductase with GAF domain
VSSGSAQAYRGALEALDRVLNRGGDADDVLRAAVEIVGQRFAWAGLLFLEDGSLVLGPHTGEPDEAHRATLPIAYQGEQVATLAVDGDVDVEARAFLERVAVLVSAYCLVGWDTGGEPWTP